MTAPDTDDEPAVSTPNTGIDGGDSLRRSIELDGRWEFVTDPANAGRTEQWYEPDATWPDRTEAVTLPRAWQEDESYREYTGTAWYRRTITLGDGVPSGEDALLRFDAVDYEATVWIDGERIGEHRGGYLPFELDVTDFLDAGDNEIVVAVTDPEDLSEVPHGKQGDPWYTRVSGVWQSVRLDFRPETRVENVDITPDLETDSAVVDLTIDPGSADLDSLRATVRAVGPEVRTDAEADPNERDADAAVAETASLAERSEVVLEFDDPSYWTLENPVLYDFVVTLERVDAGGSMDDSNDSESAVLDRYGDYFGMRSFAVEDGKFLLNGDPITIRGVLEQGYYPETLYRPPSEDTYEMEVDVAAELGFNLIRKHIKPAHPDFLEYADRNGMLVWQEPANPARYTDRSRSEVRAQLEGMIERDYNRPSVVIWSLYNEEWGIGHHDVEETLWTDEEKQQFLVDLYRDARERDPTRVVCDNSGWAHVATDINDYHRYFVSPDRSDAWTDDLDHICGFPGDNYATTEFDDPDAPIVVSELGTWGIGDVDALRERYGGDPSWFSHDFLVEPLKRPAGIDERFERTDLPDVFDGYADLAESWQEREFVSVKHLLEEMRTREDVAGYVLTELSDIEWEFNGLLDYHREPKSFVSKFGAVNDPITVAVTPSSHVARAGDSLSVELSVVNDTGAAHTGQLRWSFRSTGAGTEVAIPANGVERVETAIEIVSDGTTTDGAVPVATDDLTVSFTAEGETVETAEPITVVDDDRRATPDATVYAREAFASRLATSGLDVTHGLSDAVDVAFTTEMTDEIEQFASAGGAVVHVPGEDGEMHAGGPFSYRAIPRTESWNVVATFFYQDSALLEGVCQNRHLGWEFDGIYPYSVATDLDRSVDRVHVGYVEGWLANWGSPLVVRGYGKGSVSALTFRVGDAYGRHPVATLLCDRLVERLSGAEPR